MAATLTPEAREQCEKYIGRLLDDWKASPEDRKDLLAKNTTLKSVAVVRWRRWLVRCLRDRCWQDHRGRPENFLIDCAEPKPWAALWFPLSTTNIADLLNVTRGTVVHALKPTAKGGPVWHHQLDDEP